MPEVWLYSVPNYSQAVSLIPLIFQNMNLSLMSTRILVKPNFVSLKNASLACTNAELIAAVAQYCLDCGANVCVADGPAFGTAEAISRSIGLTKLLHPLNIPVQTLKNSVCIDTEHQGLALSRICLDADLIINMPKVKAHSQMRYTGAVKNLFGCVPGIRKAWLHARHGDKGELFTALLADIANLLPPVTSLIDGIVAMHRTGPIAGSPFPLGILGASTDPVALDTAILCSLGARAEDIPLWAYAQSKNFPGAFLESLYFPATPPEALQTTAFQFPETLRPQSFHPATLLRSIFRRIVQTLA